MASIPAFWFYFYSPKVSLFQLGFRKRTERIQPVTEDVLYDYDVRHQLISSYYYFSK